MYFNNMTISNLIKTQFKPNFYIFYKNFSTTNKDPKSLKKHRKDFLLIRGNNKIPLKINTSQNAEVSSNNFALMQNEIQEIHRKLLAQQNQIMSVQSAAGMVPPMSSTIAVPTYQNTLMPPTVFPHMLPPPPVVPPHILPPPPPPVVSPRILPPPLLTLSSTPEVSKETQTKNISNVQDSEDTFIQEHKSLLPEDSNLSKNLCSSWRTYYQELNLKQYSGKLLPLYYSLQLIIFDLTKVKYNKNWVNKTKFQNPAELFTAILVNPKIFKRDHLFTKAMVNFVQKRQGIISEFFFCFCIIYASTDAKTFSDLCFNLNSYLSTAFEGKILENILSAKSDDATIEKTLNGVFHNFNTVLMFTNMYLYKYMCFNNTLESSKVLLNQNFNDLQQTMNVEVLLDWYFRSNKKGAERAKNFCQYLFSNKNRKVSSDEAKQTEK